MDLVRKINKSTQTVNSLSGSINDYLTLFVNSYIVRLFVSSDVLINSNLWLFIKILLESNNYVVDATEFLNKIFIIHNNTVDIFSLGLSNRQDKTIMVSSQSALVLFPTISLQRITLTLYKLLGDTIEKVEKSWTYYDS